MAKNDPEYQLQKSVVEYVKLKYPNVLVNSDMSGLNLSKVQSGKAKMLRTGRGWPDFFMAEPRHGYHGIYIEFKIETIWKLDGSLKKKKQVEYIGKQRIKVETDHLKEQYDLLVKLKKKGYVAEFCWEYNQAVRLIDNYMATIYDEK